MRVLTVRQPWAWAIVHGQKDVENRVRNIAGDYRGPVAIHAGLREDTSARTHPEIVRIARDVWWTEPADMLTGRLDQFGHIIGVVDLAGVHAAIDCYQQSIHRAAHLYESDREAFDALPITNRAGGLIGRASFCSEWADDEAWHLVLANPRPLAEPIPFRGALGLRTLDPEVEAAVHARVAS